jgi:glycerol uptake facilitator protein
VEARSTTGAVTAHQPDRDERSDLDRRGLDAYAAEFLGTFLLVLFIGIIVSLHQPNPEALGVQDWAVIGLVHFFLLTMLVYTLGHASGAHFNPAVTATLTALRKIHVVDAAIYVVLQLIGAILAALLVKLILSDEGDPAGYGQTTISDAFLDGKTLSGFLVELIGTFALMWAIMGVAVNPKGARDWAGLVIGGTLGFAVMATGPLTGAGLNPARAAGPSIVGDNSEPLGDFIVAYVLGPTVGALLAGVVYTALILGPEGRLGRRPVDTLSGAAESPRGGGDIELPAGVDAPRTTGTDPTEPRP